MILGDIQLPLPLPTEAGVYPSQAPLVIPVDNGYWIQLSDGSWSWVTLPTPVGPYWASTPNPFPSTTVEEDVWKYKPQIKVRKNPIVQEDEPIFRTKASKLKLGKSLHGFGLLAPELCEPYIQRQPEQPSLFLIPAKPTIISKPALVTGIGQDGLALLL